MDRIVTLCEIQAKVSKSNYEIMSIKVRFQTLISLWFQYFTWNYSVDIKDIKVTLSQNVIYLIKDDFMYKTVNHTKKDFSWVFTARVTIAWMPKILCDAIDSHSLLEPKFRQTWKWFTWQFLTSCLMKTQCHYLVQTTTNKWRKKRKWVCVCAVPVSSPRGLWGTTH